MLTLALLADCSCSLQGIKPFMATQMLRGCQTTVQYWVNATVPVTADMHYCSLCLMIGGLHQVS